MRYVPAASIRSLLFDGVAAAPPSDSLADPVGNVRAIAGLSRGVVAVIGSDALPSEKESQIVAYLQLLQFVFFSMHASGTGESPAFVRRLVFLTDEVSPDEERELEQLATILNQHRVAAFGTLSRTLTDNDIFIQ